MTDFKANLEAYMGAIGASGLMWDRVQAAVDFYVAIYGPDRFSRIFISDLYDEGAQERTWQSLWLWGPGDLIAECRNFQLLEDRDSSVMKEIGYWKLETSGVNGVNAGTEATVALHYTNAGSGIFGGVSGDMTGSGPNAPYLLTFFQEWVVPRTLRHAAG